MTEAKLLRLAWHGALDKWNRQKELLEMNSDNELTKIREQRCYEDCLALEKMINDLKTA